MITAGRPSEDGVRIECREDVVRT